MSNRSPSPTFQTFVNGSAHPLAAGATVATLLDDLGVVARHVAVELNREVVSRNEHATRELKDGDEIEIVTLVGGG